MTSDANASLWAASCTEAPVGAPLADDLDVDLAIVGGGFTGCAAALEAARSGASACILEAREIGHGGSGRNVGLVNAGLWLPPEKIVAALGEAAGNRLVEALSDAPDLVFELIDRHAIACDPLRAGTLHCAHAPSALAGLRDRQRQGNRLGAPLRLLDAGETAERTGTARFAGALFDPRAGTIQPLALCRGIARAAGEAGARIHPRSPVTRMVRSQGRWRLSARGSEVRAGAVILATNAYHSGLDAPARPAFVPVSYLQIATAPLSADARRRILPGGEGCWDTGLVMSSFRLDAAGRLILGGIGDAAGPGGRIHGLWARRKLRRLFPGLGDVAIAHAWTGRIAMTGDHLPRILRFGPDALACYGYSGRGIGPGTRFGTLAARALVTGDMSALPIPPIERHRERLPALRGAGLEAGALLFHATEIVRSGRRG